MPVRWYVLAFRRDHVRTVKKNLHDIELEGHHLIRSAVPLEMNLS